MEKKPIVAGETLMVTCPVAGYPIETIVWERGWSHFSIYCTTVLRYNLDSL
jgi:hypothetical protein